MSRGKKLEVQLFGGTIPLIGFSQTLFPLHPRGGSLAEGG